MTDEPVKKQIKGSCAEISEKNGWTTFAVDVGTQYPVRLSTKLPALIEQGRAAGQSEAVWTFKESQGGENPNKPGTHYTNRYLDGVEVGANLDLPTAPSPAPSASDRDKAIIRQTCLKVAATLVSSTGTSDGDVGAETISLAARFEIWVRRDVDDPPFE